MVFRIRRVPGAIPLICCVLGLVASCAVDQRDTGVLSLASDCDVDRDESRCDGDFVERCEDGGWQRDFDPCDAGCVDGACRDPQSPADDAVDGGPNVPDGPGRDAPDAGGGPDEVGGEPPGADGCDNDGDACDDGLYCTVGDFCQGGECRAGMPRDCDDAVACTVGDSCDEDADRCMPGAAECAEGQVCDAASGACASTCSGCLVGGVCRADGDANPANPCEVCDPAASRDAFSPAPHTTLCDDGIGCTEDDRCSAGRCSGTALSCGDQRRCAESTGSCQPIVPGCSSGGQLVCVGGDVHECGASLLTSTRVQVCEIGCDPGSAICVGGYGLELSVAGVSITQGSSADVSLTLLRDDDHALPVAVTVLGLPPGVSAAAIELGDGDDLATLTLEVAAQAAEGVTTPLSVRADDGFRVVTRELELFVRGEPGSLDLSFGEGGRATAAPPGSPGFQGSRVAVDGSDRIVVAATSRFVLDPLGVPARASLTRFSPGGALDPRFSDGGTYLETPGSASLGEGPTTFVGDVAPSPNGYVIVGPLGEGVVQEASFLTRLDDDGQRASDFAAPTLGGGLRLTDVAVEGDVIFAVGQSLSNLALYRTDLAGGDAVRHVDPSLLSSLRAVFWSPADNDFVLAGNCDPNACFARFNADRDPPNLAVTRITAVTPSFASVVDAVADPQGRYFAITSGWSLVRFLPEPLRPAGVGALSVVVDELAETGVSPQGMVRTADHLYVAATLPDPGAETGVPTVVRYSTTWVRDAGFASGGVAQVDGSVEVGSSVDVAVQSDGRIVVATVEAGRLAVYRVWD